MLFRWLPVWVVALGVLALASSALGQRWAFHWDRPYYFSGTNARAICIAEGLVENGHLYTCMGARMYLNDHLVFEESFLRPEDTALVRVMFDSTVFGHDTLVEARIKVDGSDGQVYSDTYTAAAFNRAVCWGRFDLEIYPLTYNLEAAEYSSGSDDWMSAGRAAELLSASNYHVSTGWKLGWTAEEFLEAAEGASVVYVATHGNSANVWDDRNDYHLSYPNNPPNMAPGFIYPTAMGGGQGAVVLDSRVVANGQGLPPFNSTHLPPVNVAVLMTCDAGTTNAFAEGFLFPYANAYGGWSPFPENQAVLGFACPVYLQYLGELADVLFESLGQGLVAHRARNRVWEAFEGRDGVPQYRDGFLRVWGDFYARTKNVYTGDASSFGWFRPI